VISSQGSKARQKGEEKALAQHFRAQQKLGITSSTDDDDFSTAVIFCCM